MEHMIWLITMIPCSAAFTLLGILAMIKKQPMRFWSGTTVSESEISDISAYNRANGLMWIVFSLIFWISTFLGLWNLSIAGIVLTVGNIAGIPVLISVYSRIYRKFHIR